MGDGQHVWAAAEWILMIRNCFIREENDRLILCSGIPQHWLNTGKKIFFGPSLTRFGKVKVMIDADKEKTEVRWEAEWFDNEPEVMIRIPGYAPVKSSTGANSVEVS
jgi:hypothetical protein